MLQVLVQFEYADLFIEVFFLINFPIFLYIIVQLEFLAESPFWGQETLN